MFQPIVRSLGVATFLLGMASLIPIALPEVSAQQGFRPHYPNYQPPTHGQFPPLIGSPGSLVFGSGAGQSPSNFSGNNAVQFKGGFGGQSFQGQSGFPFGTTGFTGLFGVPGASISGAPGGSNTGAPNSLIGNGGGTNGFYGFNQRVFILPQLPTIGYSINMMGAYGMNFVGMTGSFQGYGMSFNGGFQGFAGLQGFGAGFQGFGGMQAFGNAMMGMNGIPVGGSFQGFANNGFNMQGMNFQGGMGVGGFNMQGMNFQGGMGFGAGLQGLVPGMGVNGAMGFGAGLQGFVPGMGINGTNMMGGMAGPPGPKFGFNGFSGL